jgi:hypothetical protein
MIVGAGGGKPITLPNEQTINLPAGPTGGVVVMLVGPLLLRIYFELLMLPFRINDALTDIRNNTAPPPKKG